MTAGAHHSNSEGGGFSPVRRWRAIAFYLVVVVAVSLGVIQTIQQHRETVFITQAARAAVGPAPVGDTRTTVMALRDYIRENVTRANYRSKGRPLLRDTAVETLNSGYGGCGEVTRVFINMAAAVGIPSQRLYLDGSRSHVVALVKLNDGKQILVDSLDFPYLDNLEELSQLTQHTEFKHYSSFNQRRLLVALPQNTISLGPLNYYLENPHAFLAASWFALALLLICFRILRQPLRAWRRRRARKRETGRQWETAPAGSGTV
jgi:Transglutaminase-like superfamily